MNIENWFIMQNPDFRKAFGVRLKQLRKQHHLAQKELAAKINMSFQQLNKYESGFSVPSSETLIALAKTLNTTTDYLLMGDTKANITLSNTRLLQRLSALQAFAIDEQETIITIIDAMIAKHQVTQAMKPMDDSNSL